MKPVTIARDHGSFVEIAGGIEAADRDADLPEPDRYPAAGIDQDLLVAGLDQGARAGAGGPRRRARGAEQRDEEVALGERRCRGQPRRCEPGGEDKSEDVPHLFPLGSGGIMTSSG